MKNVTKIFIACLILIKKNKGNQEMQTFSYHSHTSFNGIFDGQDTAEDMISAYENKGFTAVGISNHCIWHPSFAKLPFSSEMYFSDIEALIDTYKRCYDWIDEAASKHKIKVYKGMEVDFFPSLVWRRGFERIINEIKPEYLIGSTHFVRNKDESFLCGIYSLHQIPSNISEEEKKELYINYWNNVEAAIKSGYFNFVAHPDYICLFNLCTTPEWDEYKLKIIDALRSNNMACEINTKGLRRRGEPFPSWSMIKELVNQNIPILISDDAHGIAETGYGFADIEKELEKLNCKNRFSFNF